MAMKKLIFLFVFIIYSGSTAVSQTKDPTFDSPDFTSQKKQRFPFDTQITNPIIFSYLNPSTSIINDSSNITGICDEPYRSPTFDPVWANRFQTVLESARVAAGTKGVSLAVLVPGQGLFTGVSGISDPGGHPITMAMRFGIASCTKLFIATAMTKLQEQNVLSLEDHLYQWLPTFQNVDSTTTIRQLLSHQSGIFDYVSDTNAVVNLMMNDTSHFWTPQEILAYMGHPHFAPGHGYLYSNTNYLLAGMIIEAATGLNWVQKLHDFIFNPLTMDSTFVGAFEPRNGPVAAEWISNSYIVTNSPMTGEYSLANAAGAIFSTPQEMVEWYNSLFSGVVVSGSSLQQITDFEPTSFYGMGLEESIYKDHVSYGHGGTALGYRSKIWYDVQIKAIMCLLQNDGMTAISNKFLPLLDVLYDEFPKKQNDAGISKILSPWENSCNATVFPLVVLTNFGSAPLTSANIIYKIDEDVPAVFSWTGTLNPGDTIIVNLPQITAGNGFHQFICYTELPNGAPEGYTFNDRSKSNFNVATLPSMIGVLSESFDGNVFPPAGWALNSSSIYQWGRTPLARFIGTGSAVRCNYMDSQKGAFYNLDLPMIHIAAGTHPVLNFEYAYAAYSSSYCDSLQVLISTDCGTNWQTLFNKGCIALQTAPSTIYAFYPQSGAEWKHESFPLAAYTGDVLIRFRSVCGYGNNLYLDDVNVSFPAGIVENNSSEKFSVYPNPASYDINISGLPINSEIQISDLTGKLLMTQKTMNILTKIDIQQLQQGIYFVRSGLKVKKIVKM
jgi:CubicO group peptidase (beta-lactamase class C family)